MFEQDGLYYWREGEKHYTVGLQPMDLMSSTVGGRTPYYMSNVAKYSYTGKKWFVSVSWQSYLMAGLSTIGNGPLHNNIGVLAESSANPNAYKVISYAEDIPYQGNCRLNQDKSFMLSNIKTNSMSSTLTTGSHIPPVSQRKRRQENLS